jgi:hypothetical protein
MIFFLYPIVDFVIVSIYLLENNILNINKILTKEIEETNRGNNDFYKKKKKLMVQLIVCLSFIHMYLRYIY